MTDLGDLYQEVILDHSKHPRNFCAGGSSANTAEGYNPLCGDKVKVYVEEKGGRIERVCFEGSGCAISTASASLMTEAVKGKRREEVEELFNRFHELVRGERKEAGEAKELGKLAVFSTLSDYPMRVKCATLAWHTLRAALSGHPEPVSTE
jgi:SUF system FeS assembly protein, NifU family